MKCEIQVLLVWVTPCHHIVFLDKKLCSILSLFIQVASFIIYGCFCVFYKTVLLSDNLTDSNEDIDKLLVHDEATENAVLTDDVLHTGNERTDNLLKEITREERPYKSAELFKVNPADLENEFQDHRTLEDLRSSEKTAEVEDMFKQDAENQKEEDDQFGDDAFKPASEGKYML